MAKKQREKQSTVDIVRNKLGPVIMRLGDAPEVDIETFSTGSLSLDAALGVGGLPRGRIVEAYGPESSGKTTLALHVIASAQRQGYEAAFVDAEHALDPVYAKSIGVDVGDLMISQPDYGEQALEIVGALCEVGVGVVVVDSVAALTPKAEIEGDFGDSHMGLHARLMSQAMRKLVAVTARTKTIVYFINQTRMKIGAVWGSPVTTTGGNALKFYASVRMSVSRIGGLKKGEEQVGNRTRVKVVKNKMAPPFKEAEFDIDFGRGISREGELVDMAVDHGVIDKSGAWYAFGDENIGQGRDNTKKYLRENPDVADAIEGILRG